MFAAHSGQLGASAQQRTLIVFFKKKEWAKYALFQIMFSEFRQLKIPRQLSPRLSLQQYSCVQAESGPCFKTCSCRVHTPAQFIWYRQSFEESVWFVTSI